MWLEAEERKVGRNLDGVKAAGGSQQCLCPAGDISAGPILGLVLLEAFTDALDDNTGMASAR